MTERRNPGLTRFEDELESLSIDDYRGTASTNPYERVGKAGELPPEPPKRAPRTDLRRLSEWIKLRRELEARKAGDDDSET